MSLDTLILYYHHMLNYFQHDICNVGCHLLSFAPVNPPPSKLFCLRLNTSLENNWTTKCLNFDLIHKITNLHFKSPVMSSYTTKSNLNLVSDAYTTGLANISERMKMDSEKITYNKKINTIASYWNGTDSRSNNRLLLEKNKYIADRQDHYHGW